MSAEVIRMKKHTKHEPPATMSSEYATVALCTIIKSETETARGANSIRVKNAEYETMDISVPEVLFEVPPTEAAIFR